MTECPFCRLINDGMVQHVGRGIYALEPLNPVVPGHRLFVTPLHFTLPHEEAAWTGALFAEAARYAGEQMVAYNLIVDAGADAGQGARHVHVHYVPRAKGDRLQMPWSAQQRRAKRIADGQETEDGSVIGAWVPLSMRYPLDPDGATK